MFPSYLEVEKTGSIYFEPDKQCCQLFGERKKWIPAIWRPKNVVHRLLGASKTNIYLKSEKLVHSRQVHEKNV